MLFGRSRPEAEAANFPSGPSSAPFLPYLQVSSSGHRLSRVPRSRWALAPAEDPACFPAEEGRRVAYSSEPSLERVLLALAHTDLRNPCFERDWGFFLLA